MLWKEGKPESVNFWSNCFGFILLQITLKIGTDPESCVTFLQFLIMRMLGHVSSSGQSICLQQKHYIIISEFSSVCCLQSM